MTTAHPHLDRLDMGFVGAGFPVQVPPVGADVGGAVLHGVVAGGASGSDDAAARSTKALPDSARGNQWASIADQRADACDFDRLDSPAKG